MERDRLPTGIPELDSKLQGGVPNGSVVTLTSDSRTQAELILHHLMARNRTLYISTIANEENVERALAQSSVGVDLEQVKIAFIPSDTIVQEAKRAIKNVTEERLIVVNAINQCEYGETVTRAQYVEFLNWLQMRNERSENVALLHRYATRQPDGIGYVTDSISDILITLEEEVNEDQIVHYLHIPKNRAARPLDERVRISLGDGVRVDTTRNIA